MCGAVHTRGHLIVGAEDYTATVSMDDALRGCSDSLRLVNNYVTPNRCFGVAMSNDESHILLLGGQAKGKKPKHYVYQGKVTDILWNTAVGWQQVKSSWPHGKCCMTGGSDVADIVLTA